MTEQVYAASIARFDVGWFLCNITISHFVEYWCQSAPMPIFRAWAEALMSTLGLTTFKTGDPREKLLRSCFPKVSVLVKTCLLLEVKCPQDPLNSYSVFTLFSFEPRVTWRAAIKSRSRSSCSCSIESFSMMSSHWSVNAVKACNDYVAVNAIQSFQSGDFHLKTLHSSHFYTIL